MTTTTTTVQSHRDQMLAHLNRGNVYGFLTMADPYLNVCPDDAYARLMTVRELLKLGLIIPARDAHAVEVPPGELKEQCDALGASLRSIVAAPLPWSELGGVFEQNLIALRTRGVDTTPIETAWIHRMDHFQRFRDNNGITQVRRRGQDGLWRWVPALRDHAAADEAQAMPEGVTARMPGPYVFDGLGLGGFFERVYETTRDTFLGFSCALFVVEPDPASLAMVLHLRDWQDLLRDERVLIFTGDNWADQMRSAWARDPDLPFPTQVITAGPREDGQTAKVLSVVDGAFKASEREIQTIRTELEARYASRDINYWASRFEAALSGTGPPLRILAAVSTHTTFLQYSMRDAKRAFEALGHRCDVLIEQTCYQITSPLRFHQVVKDLDPDLFFIIDHLRAECTDILPDNLPILTWDQDQLPHVITESNIKSMAPHDYLVGCSKNTCVRLGADPRQVRHTLVPTCPEQFGGAPLSDEERSRFACDVSFVSHASQTAKAFHEQERRVFTDPALQRLLDTLFELMPDTLGRYQVPSAYVTSTVLEAGMRRCGIPHLTPELETRLKEWYLWRLGDRLFRHEALEWAADWARRNNRTLRIYGNGWEDHPTLSSYAAGPARNGRELLCIYRASTINLQLMPAGFLHQRAMDGLAAGGFFLTRKTPRDVTGRTLRSLVERIESLGIRDDAALRTTTDERIRSGLSDVLGPWLEHFTNRGRTLIDYLCFAAEVRYPDELFPRFPQIVFDSSDSFANTANRFIDDDMLRADITREMRTVVVRELSYRPTMNRFLTWMRDYLRGRAVDKTETASSDGQQEKGGDAHAI